MSALSAIMDDLALVGDDGGKEARQRDVKTAFRARSAINQLAAALEELVAVEDLRDQAWSLYGVERCADGSDAALVEAHDSAVAQANAREPAAWVAARAALKDMQ